jgi:CheY-like chemotaxis protein
MVAALTRTPSPVPKPKPVQEPVIIILDDERIQLKTLHAQLTGVGSIFEFSHPRDALLFARDTHADAAIVDIRMPNCEMNGLDFLRELRTFDSDIAVIIRTADESMEIADAALEHRAYRRVVKSHSSREEICNLTREAIRETQARRKNTSDAADGLTLKRELAAITGSNDDQITIANGCRGILHTLRNHITTLAGFTYLLKARSQVVTFDPECGRLVGTIHNITDRMVEEARGFFAGPFFEQRKEAQAQVNTTIRQMLSTLNSQQEWNGRSMAMIDWIPLEHEVSVSLSQPRLEAAVKNVVEFCFLRAPSESTVRISTAYIEKPDEDLQHTGKGAIVFNRQLLTGRSHHVRLSVSAPLGDHAIEAIRAEFHRAPDKLGAASLLLFGSYMTDDRCAFAVSREEENTVFRVYLAVPFA